MRGSLTRMAIEQMRLAAGAGSYSFGAIVALEDSATTAGYNAPITPNFLKHNEILIEIQE